MYKRQFLDPAGEISPASLDAVRTARAAGVKVVLSTGRSGAEAAHFSQLAGCDSLAVCLGGAALCDARTGRHPVSYTHLLGPASTVTSPG